MVKWSAYTFYGFTAVLLTSAFLSCKNSKGETKKESSDAFAGIWIAKEFADNIITGNGIKTVDNGVTEIIVPSNIKDSIVFLNEDLERDKHKAAIIKDTLINYLYEGVTQKAFLKNGSLILLPLDNRYQTQEYKKGDSSLIKKAKEANVSVVRILINRVLSVNTYFEKSLKSEIKFDEDGKVNGLPDFKSYYISINGDGAFAEDVTVITFKTLKGSEKSLGIEFGKDKVELYDLKLITQPDEKPAYQKGKLLYSLLKTK